MRRAGLKAGNVTDLALSVTSAQSQTMNNFKVKIKAISPSSLSAFQSMSHTFYSGTWKAAVGWNKISATNPFYWNGRDNLLIEVSFDNTRWTRSSSVHYHTTSNQSVWYRYSDSGAGVSENMTGGSGSRNRPDIRFFTTQTGDSSFASNYNNTSLPTVGRTILAETIYDNPAYAPKKNGQYAPYSKGRAVVSYTAVLNPKSTYDVLTYNYTQSFYDNRGCMVETIDRDNLHNATRTLISDYNFNGTLNQTKDKTQQQMGSSLALEMVEKYYYDNRSRLTKTIHDVNGDRNQLGVATHYKYDALGRMYKQEHGDLKKSQFGFYTYWGSATVASTQYTFDNRGNATQTLTRGSNGQSLYKLKLSYGYKNKFISSSTLQIGGDAAQDLTTYYYYDAFNRLDRTGTQQNSYRSISGNYIVNRLCSNCYETNYDYDADGNITKLQRYANAVGRRLIDNLDYYYDGGQLGRVEDRSNHSLGFKGRSYYLYDQNGNQISDSGKEINKIHYNHLNLSRRIELTSNRWIEFTYDVQGNMLRRETSANQTKDFVQGFEYLNNKLEAIYTSVARLVPVNASSSSGWRRYFRYEYSLSDHLGNVNATIADIDGNGNITKLEILQKKIYYTNE